MFSIHPEPFTVVTWADSGVKTFDYLQGKRVNRENPGSGAAGSGAPLAARPHDTRRGIGTSNRPVLFAVDISTPHRDDIVLQNAAKLAETEGMPR